MGGVGARLAWEFCAVARQEQRMVKVRIASGKSLVKKKWIVEGCAFMRFSDSRAKSLRRNSTLGALKALRRFRSGTNWCGISSKAARPGGLATAGGTRGAVMPVWE